MSNKKFKIKKGDQVIVLTGKNKGSKGEVLKIITKTDRAIVAGVNVVKKHEKQSATSSGGIIEKELPIHISNIALIDPKNEGATRVGYKTLDDGKKVRFARKSGEVIA